jgi:hypothetical protein
MSIYYKDHFSSDRKLTDPSLVKTDYQVFESEVTNLFKRITKNKALGWGCIPREIFNPIETELEEKEWINFNIRFLSHIINTGIIP